MANNGHATVLAEERPPPSSIKNGQTTTTREAHDLMAGNRNADSKAADNLTNGNVIQVPTWAITAFAIPAILLVVWLTSFWTATNMEIQSLKTSIDRQRLEAETRAKELRNDVRLQDAWLRETREKMIAIGIKDIPPVPDISRPREGDR